MLSAGKPQEYILVWSGDEPKQINSIGELVFVPGINEVSQGKGQYRYPAAVINGRPLPGTVAIHDIFSSINGEVRKVFDALSFCQMLEVNQKALFDMGFDIVLRPEEVAEAQEKGREKWERAEFVHLEEIVRHATRVDNWCNLICHPNMIFAFDLVRFISQLLSSKLLTNVIIAS